jgi:hypothetical protein
MNIKDTEEVDDSLQKIAEGRDINVVIRARPLLDFEVKESYFDLTHSKNKNFYFFNPKLNLKGELAPINVDENKVDFAYGVNDDNQKIFDQMMLPLIDMSL